MHTFEQSKKGMKFNMKEIKDFLMKFRGAIIDECSSSVVIMCLPRFLYFEVTPLIAKLFASLAPLV